MSKKCEVLSAKPAIRGFRFKAFWPGCPRNLLGDSATRGFSNIRFLIQRNDFCIVFLKSRIEGRGSSTECRVASVKWRFSGRKKKDNRSIPSQEDHACVPKRPVTRCASVAEGTSACRHGFYPWVNWSSGTGCSPRVGVSWVPRPLPLGLHEEKVGRTNH